MEIDIDKEKLKENAEKLKQQGAEIGKTAAWMVKSFFGSKDKSLPSLCDGLIHQGTVGRIYAAEMLFKNITPDYLNAIPYLIEALTDGEPKVASKAAAILAKFGKKAVFAIYGLKNCAESAIEAEVRQAAEDAMAVIGNNPVEGFSQAVENLSSPNGFIRVYSAELIGSLGVAARNAVPYLKDIVQDSDANVRVAAIKALAEMKHYAAPAVSVIIERLTIDDNIEVRKNAILSLAKIGPAATGVKEALIDASSSDDKEISEVALSNLGKLGADAVPVLIKVLKEGPIAKKRKAALVLGDLGKDGQPAMDALSMYLSDDDTLLRSISKKSIQKIKKAIRGY